MQLKLLVEGGNAKPGPSLSQQLGPLGINLGKLIADVNKASEKYKGIKVPVIVDIDPSTKTFTVSLRNPPTSELIKKELALVKGAADSKAKIGNLALEQAIKIAKSKQEDMLVNSFKEAVKSVVGTCTSLGVLVEGKEPKDTIKDINAGKYDSIINTQVTEVSAEKTKLLEKQLAEVKAIIEKRKKAEEAEKAAEEAKAKKAQVPEAEKPEAGAEAGAGEGKGAEAKAAKAAPEAKEAKAPMKGKEAKPEAKKK